MPEGKALWAWARNFPRIARLQKPRVSQYCDSIPLTVLDRTGSRTISRE
jgi:hypothetical protein